ncbi:unnamed protein product [Leptosia nina]|uniref:YDG domain-containing protein n=1 Tax=Leptosia nina TaxID=320188 RepID=A0AAV1JF52_9NEOP
MALARNCAANTLNEDGADAGDAWKSGLPVRIVRSYRMLKHFPTYAPKEGYRYDGVYKVVKYYPEKGLSGYNVWKYLLRRDDPNPAPWEPEAKQFSVIWCRSNPGHHNFCMVCLKVALESSESRQCPRSKNISYAELTPNDELKNALKMFLPGYDAGEK